MSSLSHIKIYLAAAALAALTLTAASCGGSRAQANKKAPEAEATPPAVEVSTVAAVRRDLPRYVEATGGLAADEQTDVAPTVGGRVVAVAVDLGSYVQKGQPLVRLDAADAQLRLEQAQAALAQAQAGVRQAEERIGLRPGQRFEAT